MGLMIVQEPVPLETTEEGVIRVAGTRVTLDTVVAAFEQGATAEEIVQQYPSLQLADAYAVIGYYLHHRAEVEAYLARRGEDSRRVRHENESRFDPTAVRARLLAAVPNEWLEPMLPLAADENFNNDIVGRHSLARSTQLSRRVGRPNPLLATVECGADLFSKAEALGRQRPKSRRP